MVSIAADRAVLAQLEAAPSALAFSFPDDLPYDRWADYGRAFGLMDRAARWWIGEWVNYGERRYGEKYSQALNDTGLDEGTLRNAAWLARKFEPGRRRASLSWSHHADVAGLAREEADAWLDRAEAGGWSRAELRHALQAGREHPATVALPPPEALGEGEQCHAGVTTDADPVMGRIRSEAGAILASPDTWPARDAVAEAQQRTVAVPLDPLLAAVALAPHFTLADLARHWPADRLGGGDGQ